MAERKFFYNDGSQQYPISANYLRVIPPRATDHVGKAVQEAARSNKLFSGGGLYPDPLQETTSDVIIIRPVTGKEEIITPIAPVSSPGITTLMEPAALREIPQVPPSIPNEPVFLEDVLMGIEHESIEHVYLPSLSEGMHIVLTSRDAENPDGTPLQAKVRVIRPSIRSVLNPTNVVAPLVMIESNKGLFNQPHGELSLFGTDFSLDNDNSGNLSLFQGFPLCYVDRNDRLARTEPIDAIQLFDRNDNKLNPRALIDTVFINDEQRKRTLASISTLYDHMLDVFQNDPDDVFRYHHVIDFALSGKIAGEEYVYGSLNKMDMVFLERDKLTGALIGVILYDPFEKKSYTISQSPPINSQEKLYTVQVAKLSHLPENPAPVDILRQHRNAKVFAGYNVSNMKNIDDSRYAAIQASQFNGLLHDGWVYYCVRASGAQETLMQFPQDERYANAFSGMVVNTIGLECNVSQNKLAIVYPGKLMAHVFPYEVPVDKMDQLFRKTHG